MRTPSRTTVFAAPNFSPWIGISGLFVALTFGWTAMVEADLTGRIVIAGHDQIAKQWPYTPISISS